ncbi:MAG: hypothetical protein FJX03_01230 [Alphaproteobacteria bacterium]|nr:hypothetical protein [Alphaproteobacteria bacterium]
MRREKLIFKSYKKATFFNTLLIIANYPRMRATNYKGRLMANKSKKNSGFSDFTDTSGISDEWQNISAQFMNLLQQTVTENSKAFGETLSADTKATHTSAEWKTFWNKVFEETQNTINKNLKDLGTPAAKQKIPTNQEQWKEFWENIANETKKNMTKHSRNLSESAFPNMGDMSLDSKFIKGVFQKNKEKCKKLEELQAQYLKEYSKLFHSTIKTFQETMMKGFENVESKGNDFNQASWGKNPYAYIAKQAYLMNLKFFKDVMKS